MNFKEKFYERLSHSIPFFVEELRAKISYVPFNFYDDSTPSLMTYGLPQHKDAIMQAYIDNAVCKFFS